MFTLSLASASCLFQGSHIFGRYVEVAVFIALRKQQSLDRQALILLKHPNPERERKFPSQSFPQVAATFPPMGFAEADTGVGVGQP